MIKILIVSLTLVERYIFCKLLWVLGEGNKKGFKEKNGGCVKGGGDKFINIKLFLCFSGDGGCRGLDKLYVNIPDCQYIDFFPAKSCICLCIYL